MYSPIRRTTPFITNVSTLIFSSTSTGKVSLMFPEFWSRHLAPEARPVGGTTSDKSGHRHLSPLRTMYTAHSDAAKLSEKARKRFYRGQNQPRVRIPCLYPRKRRHNCLMVPVTEADTALIDPQRRGPGAALPVTNLGADA